MHSLPTRKLKITWKVLTRKLVAISCTKRLPAAAAKKSREKVDDNSDLDSDKKHEFHDHFPVDCTASFKLVVKVDLLVLSSVMMSWKKCVHEKTIVNVKK